MASLIPLARSRGDPSVATYARRWLAARRAAGLRCAEDYSSLLECYLIPALGRRRVRHLDPAIARAFHRRLQELVAAEQIAPRTARNAWCLLSTLCRAARAEGLLVEDPCVLSPGEAIADRDRDPGWRSTAIFSREEIEQILSSEDIRPVAKVLLALGALTGLRAGEISALRVGSIDWSAMPLPRLTSTRAWATKRAEERGRKTWEPAIVPVHPVLAAILRPWLDSGWARTFGRAPTADDLLLPCRSRKGLPVPLRNDRSAKWRARALAIEGLRARRTHDLRRTLITLAREDRVDEAIFSRITHPRNRRCARELYAEVSWKDLCAEMLKVKLVLREPRQLRLL